MKKKEKCENKNFWKNGGTMTWKALLSEWKTSENNAHTLRVIGYDNEKNWKCWVQYFRTWND